MRIESQVVDMTPAASERDRTLDRLVSHVPDLDRSPKTFHLLETYYFELCRRRAFRTTMFHSREAFEKAMGLYWGSVLVAEGRAEWVLGADASTWGVAESGGTGAIADVGAVCRDWHRLSGDARRSPLSRLFSAPWSEVADAGSARASTKERRPAPAKLVPPRSLKEAKALLDPILEQSMRPYVRIVGKRRAGPLPLWSSKACDGRPYLPKDVPWPKVGGERLLPVMQIDLSEVPSLPGFPKGGLLSVFWSADYTRSRILYFPHIHRDEAKLRTDFPELDEDDLAPYGRPTALTFERREGCVSWGDVRFEELLGKALVDALDRSPAFDAIWNYVWERAGGADTRLGGYAMPEQEDPRASRRARRFETHLLQIQNDNLVHNYFAEPAALKRADFTHVLYHSGCD